MQGERFVQYTTSMLRLLAFSPLNPNESFYYKTWYYLYRTISITCGSTILALALIEMQFSIRSGMRFSDYSQTLVVLAVYISMTSKTNYFYIFDTKHIAITSSIKRLFKLTTDTKLIERQFEDYARMADILSAFWVIAAVVGTQIYMLIPAMLTGEGSLPLKIWYPFSEDDKSLYVLMYGFQVFTQNLMVFNFVITDMFYITINVITCSQFRLIAWEYEYMCYTALSNCGVSKEDVLAFKDNAEERLNTIPLIYEIMQSETYTEELNKKFVEIIDFHRDLLKFWADFENFISPVMLTTTLSSISHVTVTTFMFVTAATLAETVSSVSYVFLTLFHIFTINFVGQQIINHSSQLEHTLYNCPWYLCNRRFLKMFKFAHLRSQECAFLTIGKFSAINLETFMWIIKTCASYLALLRNLDQEKI